MRKKRIVCALFPAALLLLGGMLSAAVAQVTFNTSTVAVDVRSDLDEIGARTGRTLNLAILGLDFFGNVDIFGEAGGSTIIASITSVIGTVPIGGGAPGRALPGSLAAETKYVTLLEGIGEAHVSYPADASGTDFITVRLYELRFDAGGNASTRLIDTASLAIPVAAAAPGANILNIERFTKALTDLNGANASTTANPARESADGRIGGGQMTVNHAGGEFLIRAYKVNADRTYTFDGNAFGSVTVTLTGDPTATEPLGGNRASAATTYSATGTMHNGEAEVAVPSGFTRAGQYKVVATLGSLGSVPSRVSDNGATQDVIFLVPEALPRKVTLSSNLSVISNTPALNVAPAAGVDGVTFDPTFTADLVDSFGNKVVAASSPGGTVEVTDENAKFPDFTITIAAGTNSQSLLVDGSQATPGLASFRGSVPLNPLVSLSDPLRVTIRPAANQLVIGPAAGMNLPNIPVAVGTPFAFTPTGIGVDNVTQNGIGDAAGELTALLASDQIKITSQTPKADGTTESITVGVKNGTPDGVLALFTTATSAGNLQAKGFKVEDTSGSYAGFFAYPDTTSNLTFTVGSPTQAFIKDAAGRVVDAIPAALLPDGTFALTLNGARVTLTDVSGNLNNQGTLTIRTTRGAASGTIAVGDPATSILITYPAGTTGEDTSTLSFSQPGIAPVNGGLGFKVTFPTVGTLARFDTYPAGPFDEPIKLGINAVTPLTVLPRSTSGATITVADGYLVDYDTGGLAVRRISGAVLASGSNVGAGIGRFVMQVVAKTIPGDYKLAVKSVDGTITQQVNFMVVGYPPLPLAVSRTNVVLMVGSKEDITISGGKPPYVAASGDPTMVTASVSGTTLTVTGVKLGGPVNVVVTDGAGGQATVSVSVATDGHVLGCDVGINSYTVGAASPLTLCINITDNGVNPPAGVVQEWLVFGAIINGKQSPFLFFTDAGQVVALSDTTDPAAVEFTFNHTAPVQTLTTNFVLSSLAFHPDDTFFYLYAWSPTTVTSFSNAPDLQFDNVVLLKVR